MKRAETKPLLVNSRVASKLLGVSTKTLSAMRVRGQLEAVPVNPRSKTKVWLYRYESIEKFVNGGQEVSK